MVGSVPSSLDWPERMLYSVCRGSFSKWIRLPKILMPTVSDYRFKKSSIVANVEELLRYAGKGVT